ncbi:MAG: efflux RND transporter periplasmic adaptor subunit [Paludibacter sp.]|nr:efflux RND transporter periplasmic adaptor subunit [Paludibacter sp.]
MKKWNYSLVMVLSLLLAACSGEGLLGDKEEESGSKRIVETGELAAVNSRSFTIQRFGRRWNSFRIIGILKHGTRVEAGDSVIQLDPSEIQKYIIDREGDLESQLASLEKLQVDQSNRRNDLESRMKNEVATFELKKLELEAARFESDRIRKVKELEFEQAKITFERAQRQLELNKISERNDLKIQKIRVERLRNDIRSAYDILPQLTIRTPISGIFQIARNRRSRELVKVGDELYQNNPIGNVPDLTWMKVNTTINELDFMKLSMGQQVNVRLDAMPEVVFKGEVAYIGKLCRLKDDKSKQKVFDVEVNLLEPDERLKPGMTVSCEFLIP